MLLVVLILLCDFCFIAVIRSSIALCELLCGVSLISHDISRFRSTHPRQAGYAPVECVISNYYAAEGSAAAADGHMYAYFGVHVFVCRCMCVHVYVCLLVCYYGHCFAPPSQPSCQPVNLQQI